MHVFAGTAGNPAEPKLRQMCVPNSELLFAEGVAELGKGKHIYLVPPELWSCQKKLCLLV